MGMKSRIINSIGRKTMSLVGWRTILAAILKLVLQLAISQGWIPDVDENQFVAMINAIIEAAIWIFLALKGNRMLGDMGHPVKGMGKGLRK